MPLNQKIFWTDNCFVSLLIILLSITVAALFVFITLQTNSALLANGSARRKYKYQRI